MDHGEPVRSRRSRGGIKEVHSPQSICETPRPRLAAQLDALKDGAGGWVGDVCKDGFPPAIASFSYSTT